MGRDGRSGGSEDWRRRCTVSRCTVCPGAWTRDSRSETVVALRASTAHSYSSLLGRVHASSFALIGRACACHRPRSTAAATLPERAAAGGAAYGLPAARTAQIPRRGARHDPAQRALRAVCLPLPNPPTIGRLTARRWLGSLYEDYPKQHDDHAQDTRQTEGNPDNFERTSRIEDQRRKQLPGNH
jgi:hypothetical protein